MVIQEVVGGTDSDGGTTQVDEEGPVGDTNRNAKAKVVRWAANVQGDGDAEGSLDDGDEDDEDEVRLPGERAAELHGLAGGRGDPVVGSDRA